MAAVESARRLLFFYPMNQIIKFVLLFPGGTTVFCSILGTMAQQCRVR